MDEIKSLLSDTIKTSPSSTASTRSTGSPPVTGLPSSAADSLLLTSVDGDSSSENYDDGDDDRDIAIIGMACRVPGGNNSPARLWDYLMNRGDASGDMAAFRWEPYRARHPHNADTLARTTSKGYYVDNIADFDAGFFAVSPREAEQMDPQQRIALEVAWEALEDAGISPQQLSGTDTSVYMGVNSDDYGKLVLEDLPHVGAHMGVGTAYCGIPSRISYLLNLMGPSIAIDAACAASLVAVHQARQAILAGETHLALAGGVNALLGPGLTRVLDEAGAISADGRCRSFDDSASGYGRGEGAGLVVLKRLSQALADGDRIHALLKGSAVLADGKTLGIMAPNPVAQQMVAEKALKEARVSAESIVYVEAHATSTPIGDPSEMAALARVYGDGARPARAEPCLVGSIKANIGHLEAGAGVMGLIKAVMVLQKGVVPPQANLYTLNRKIPWETNMLKPCTEPTALPRLHAGMRPRAAVASYGYSGTVSHAILEAAPPSYPIHIHDDTTNEHDDKHETIVNLCLSAPQESRLPAAAASLAHWLETEGSDIPLDDVATTLASRRSHHKFRATVTAESKSEAILLLQRLSQSRDGPFISRGSSTGTGVVWVFSGHGSHWPEMGRELFVTEPAFAAVLRHVDPIVKCEIGFSAIEALMSGSFVDRSDQIQVMTFIMHVGLATLLMNRAGPPDAVVGHSLGEAAAAVVVGALRLDEGIRVVCRRARLYQKVMGSGAMLLVSVPVEDEALAAILADYPDVVVAIDTSPSSCVLSGPKASIETLTKEFVQREIRHFSVRSDIAFHSPMLQELDEPLRNSLSNALCPQPPKITLYSTSSSDPRDPGLCGVEYWIRNMVEPVLLRGAIKAAAADGFRAFVEVSSHPIVAHSITETLSDAGFPDCIVVPTMLRNKPAAKQLMACVGRLHSFGCSVAYTEPSNRSWAVDMPTTQWIHKRYWREVSKLPTVAATHDASSNHLLGSRNDIWGRGEVLFITRLDEKNKPFPGSHPLHGSEIVPAAVLINTFLVAARSSGPQDHGDFSLSLRNMSLKVPVSVSPPRDIQILMDNRGQTITIASRLVPRDDEGDGAWLANTTTQMEDDNDDDKAALAKSSINLDETRKRLSNVLPIDFSVSYLAGVGVPDMGFPWRVVDHIANDDEMLATVEANPNGIAGMRSSLTSMLDSATSIASTLFYAKPELRMPTSVGRIIAAPGVVSGEREQDLRVGFVYCKKNLSSASSSPTVADILVCSQDGEVLVKFEAMAFAPLDGGIGERRQQNAASMCHQIAWTPAILAETPLGFNHVVFFSAEHDDGGDTEECGQKMRSNASAVGLYRAQLAARGLRSSFVTKTSDLDAAVASQTSPVIVHIAQVANSPDMIKTAASRACQTLVSAVKLLFNSGNSSNAGHKTCKLFSLVTREDKEEGKSALHALSCAPLYGLARIIQSEHPEFFGGLLEIKNEEAVFPLGALRHVQGVDVIKVDDDGIPRSAVLRPLVGARRTKTRSATENKQRRDDDGDSKKLVHFSPGGTYLITGGLGALGLEVATWMVQRGARRLVLVSRRALPPRSTWLELSGNNDCTTRPSLAIRRILKLEEQGATVRVVALDIGAPGADAHLKDALTKLDLPPVKGVVHAAGVLQDQLVSQITTDAFDRVLDPKVAGALHLDAAFPPGTLDFFTLFSSCGQLLGFPGQASYASANAFLDALAEQRWAAGRRQAKKDTQIPIKVREKVMAILWTSWRGLGMAASTEYIDAELSARGIGDITVDEAFKAWDRIDATLDAHDDSEDGEDDADGRSIHNAAASVVVLRALELDLHEPVPHPVLRDIAPRQRQAAVVAAAEEGHGKGEKKQMTGQELESHLMSTIRGCVASVLGMSNDEDVDSSVALAEMGMDSVMTVQFRVEMQRSLGGVRMAPTLVWKCPTVNHLVKHFMEELGKGDK
ncbi:hypothetical protein HD806DRAFT_450461 [Xylariaceae sp. AK1471]|nr:hypothetical protein HD806DRAFT_450461 [Xylariaceae sp. AK1471]